MSDDTERPFRWEEIDQRLLSPKTNDLAEEMHKLAADAEGRINFEVSKSGNRAGYLPRLFDFHEKLADQWAERLYAAYCEAWNQQNRSVTGEFTRSIWNRAISPMIAARKSSLSFQVTLRSNRIGESLNSVALGDWHRRMDRLANRWARKLEAEAVANEYRAVRENQLSQTHTNSAKLVDPQSACLTGDEHAEYQKSLNPEVWRAFHDRFRALSEEELKAGPRNVGDRWLRAYVSYKDPNSHFGSWHLSEGLNEGFRERFDVEAARAGHALRSTLDTNKRDVWLNLVFLDLLKHESKLLFAATKEEGGIIVRVCEASAIYCSRVEKKALEQSSGHQSRASTHSESDFTEKTRREAIIRKVQNPQAHTILSTPDAALYFEVQVRTIHRWKGEGKLRSGPRRGSITIESILMWQKKRSRKRPNL